MSHDRRSSSAASTRSRSHSRSHSRSRSGAYDVNELAGASSNPPSKYDFVNAFWGERGYDVLTAKMRVGSKTLSDLRNFYRERSSIEEEYAKKMQKLARQTLGKDETGTLKAALEGLKAEVDSSGKAHAALASWLKGTLDNQTKDFEGNRENKRKNLHPVVEKLHKNMAHQESYVNKAREKYRTDCISINGLNAQSSLTQGKDLDKVSAKLDKFEQTVRVNEREYKQYIDAMTETIGKWNVEWKSFCDLCQDLEEERVEFIRISLWEYANGTSLVCVKDDESCENIRKVLEACDYVRDLKQFTRDFHTGSEIKEPPPFIDFSKGHTIEASQKSTAPKVAHFPRSSSKVEVLSNPSTLSELNNMMRPSGTGFTMPQFPHDPELDQDPKKPAQPAQPQQPTQAPVQAQQQQQDYQNQPQQQRQATAPTTPTNAVPNTAQQEPPVHTSNQAPNSAAYSTVPRAVSPPTSNGGLTRQKSLNSPAAAFEAAISGTKQEDQKPETDSIPTAPPVFNRPSTTDPTPTPPPSKPSAETVPVATTNSAVGHQLPPASAPRSTNASPAGGQKVPLQKAPAISEAPKLPPATKKDDDEDPLVAALRDLRDPSKIHSPYRPTGLPASSSSNAGTPTASDSPRKQKSTTELKSRPTSSSGHRRSPSPHRAPSPVAAMMQPPNSNSSNTEQANQVVSEYGQAFPGEREKRTSVSSTGSKRHTRGQSIANDSRCPSPGPNANGGNTGGSASSRNTFAGVGANGRSTSPQPFRPTSPNIPSNPSSLYRNEPTPLGITLDANGKVTHDQLADQYRASMNSRQQQRSQQQQQQQQQQQPQPQQQQYQQALPQQQQQQPVQQQPQQIPQHQPQVPPSDLHYSGSVSYQNQQQPYYQSSQAPVFDPNSAPVSQQFPAQYNGQPWNHVQQQQPQPQHVPMGYQQQPNGVGYPMSQPMSAPNNMAPVAVSQGMPMQQGGEPFRQHSLRQQTASPAPPPAPLAQALPGQQTSSGRPILFHVEALYDYHARANDEFDFSAGDVIAVTKTEVDGWWTGEFVNDKRRTQNGYTFPSNFVRIIESS